MTSGILPINKPKGISSFDVIRAIKKILPGDLKREKIGHGGTLDSLAEGVLPILFGEATKAFDFLLNSDKIYRATIQFGASTDTDDREGKILQEFEKRISQKELEAVLPKFTGKIEQLPPKFSALRINGVRSYELARQEKEVILKPRTVEIFGLLVEHFDETFQRLTLTVNCSSGTYIRSLARDIGACLGSGGYILELLRTKSAGITLEQCHRLDSLSGDRIGKLLLDLNETLDYPSLQLKISGDHIRNGKALKDDLFLNVPAQNGIFKITEKDRLLALIEKNDKGYKYLRVFNL